jgi:putative PIN family toxin of toxin-antitoxin system
MTRVVLDTNVVVSAMLATSGNEARVLDLVFAGRLIACITKEVLAEYDEVLHRPRFRSLTEAQIHATLEGLAQGEMIRPGFSLTVSPDAKDNRFLECADAAEADFLVTGNRRHFPALWKNTRIVNARELLEAIL